MVPESTAAASSSPQSQPWPTALAIAPPQALPQVASTDTRPSPTIVTATILTTLSQAQDHPLAASPAISAGQKPLPFVQQAPPQPLLKSLTAPDSEPDATKHVRQIHKKKVHCLYHHPFDSCCCSLPYYPVR